MRIIYAIYKHLEQKYQNNYFDFFKIYLSLLENTQKIEFIELFSVFLFSELKGNVTEFVKKTEDSEVIQGEFSLKNLGYFIKCTNLCNNIEMFLENDLPLVVKYSVASLGEIKLCLAPLPAN